MPRAPRLHLHPDGGARIGGYANRAQRDLAGGASPLPDPSGRERGENFQSKPGYSTKNVGFEQAGRWPGI
jgi:hypothetical protein